MPPSGGTIIRSVVDTETERVWPGERSRKLPPDIQQTARRKLRQLEAAERLDDMRAPRGNRLEQLKGMAPPRYGIRINDQWRITFRWSDGGAEDVGIEDYHRG
ncbi:type II toxin-antitoxin system RelE/ParE family toxin [Sphingomonas sp.]|uniref:type II toxin-antitoxin system RelE/ParE family toxin n=1 Tax=Sphingomonas sp. TaxID=28214 RepID=UPI002D80EC9F|nr:type II toxin-antitoxin system RelE/ParE family toxin [Sphingomonas sp.]HEU0042967.1 type II toxin-antitoxin system RelE/ParE family toxin [Sphingomonas sp.]